LQALDEHEHITVSEVVTYEPPHDGWWSGSLWDSAEKLGIEPTPIEGEHRLLESGVDWILSVQYPNIIGSELLNHPSKGAVNLHQAELPRYRGSNLFNHVILNARGDDHWRHGTTLHVMTEKVDKGEIIDREFVEITADDTAKSLYNRTEDASVELLKSSLGRFVDGSLLDRTTPQSEFDGPRYFYKREDIEGEKKIPRDELADPSNETAIYDRIRAFDFPPFEPTHTSINGQKIYLTKNGYESRDSAPNDGDGRS
jgi:methionyl-tRNA formyltransferase